MSEPKPGALLLSLGGKLPEKMRGRDKEDDEKDHEGKVDAMRSLLQASKDFDDASDDDDAKTEAAEAALEAYETLAELCEPEEVDEEDDEDAA